MIIALLVILMLSILIIVITGLTSQKKIDESVREVLANGNLNSIYAEYKQSKQTTLLCAIAGGLLTALFAATFFSGGELNPYTWGVGQWVAVAVGMVCVFAITRTQYNLYQAIDGNKTALFSTIIILCFVFFSEIATTAERESELVKSRSLNSPTLQATLENIKTANAPMVTGYEESLIKAKASLATHQSELLNCSKYSDTDKKAKCERYENTKIAEYQATVNQYEALNAGALKARLDNTSLMINTSHDMEYDEKQHSSMIRFIAEFFGVSSLSAMMFASFLLVNAFELGFHFSGSRTAILKRALAELGYSLDQVPDLPKVVNHYGQAVASPTLEKQQNDDDKNGQKIAVYTQPIHGKNTANTANNQSAVEADTEGYTANTQPIHGDNTAKVTVTDEIGQMIERYEAVKHVKNGGLMTCPTCERDVTKTAHNKRFCSSGCKDEYHNTANPERLAFAKKTYLKDSKEYSNGIYHQYFNDGSWLITHDGKETLKRADNFDTHILKENIRLYELTGGNVISDDDVKPLVYQVELEQQNKAFSDYDNKHGEYRSVNNGSRVGAWMSAS